MSSDRVGEYGRVLGGRSAGAPEAVHDGCAGQDDQRQREGEECEPPDRGVRAAVVGHAACDEGDRREREEDRHRAVAAELVRLGCLCWGLGAEPLV
jgi:hypothetical protein